MVGPTTDSCLNCNIRSLRSPEKGNDKVTSQEPLFMANDKVADSGAVLLQEIETVGFYLGPILLVISLFLMFRGHEKLYVVAGITGAGIGYVLTPMVHSQLQNSFEIEIRLLYVLMAMVLISWLYLWQPSCNTASE